jgi:predicted HTH domain antitoxin
MNILETTVEELRSLRPGQLEAAARYIHRLKLAGHRADRPSLALAIGLFVSEDATLGQAAEVAGLAQADFLHELGKRRIPIHYGPEELAEDLRVLETLAPR